VAEALLTLDGVHTHIGQHHILQGVSFEVPEGGITVLLGRNGAGKTTCLRTIMGLWRASQGRIAFEGESIAGLDTPSIARRGIAYVPENMGLFTDLTVDILLMIVIGGMGTMYGAVIGATVFIIAQNYLQNLMKLAAEATASVPLLPNLLHPDRWLLWLGLLFILSVYFFPTGMVGRLRGRSA
jgi:ABC-type branched-subunit amino acid transport system ATPase component